MGFLIPKMRKPRGFNYQPRFWDPEKERKEERLKRIKREMGMLPDEEYSSSNIRGAFTKKSGPYDREKPAKSASSNFMLLLLLAVLVAVAYYLYYA